MFYEMFWLKRYREIRIYTQYITIKLYHNLYHSLWYINIGRDWRSHSIFRRVLLPSKVFRRVQQLPAFNTKFLHKWVKYDTVHEQRYILVPSQFDANFFKNKRSFMQLSTLGFKGDAGEHFRPKNRPRKAYRVLNLHFLWKKYP